MNYSSSITRYFLIFLSIIGFYSCKTSGPGIFGKKSPHEQYGDRLTSAGLRSTVLGTSWFRIAESSISSPLSVTVPYQETGYFAADRPAAAGYRFSAIRGQTLSITVQRNPRSGFTIYVDLWKAGDVNKPPKHIASADTSSYTIQHEVEDNSNYLLRIQPELLGSGEYTITITAGPSLAYPIKAQGKDHIKSFWGADRDGGLRKHEGIDLFAPLRTPVLAAATGKVTRVDETPIGGKVVWLRPEEKKYTLYYAHLDSQMVKDGQSVTIGDTIGLMGNTGNARSTAPHLHFGIYAFGGPVDPLPFVDPREKIPAKISASSALLGKMGRSNNSAASIFSEPIQNSVGKITIPPHTIVMIEAATSTLYKVSLPDGRQGYIKNNLIDELNKPIRKFNVKASTSVFDKPDTIAAKKASIASGETVDILANFDSYYFISTPDKITGWIKK